MVYRGKPSRKCLACRRRKLKCDLEPAACGQCLRAGLECHGYRDTDALRVNDESQAVKAKVLSKRSSGLGPALADATDVLARNVFFYHYVTNDLRTYNYLEGYYHEDPPEHLLASVDAVSLAFLAQRVHAPLVHAQAQKQYGVALKCIRNAVQNERVIALDCTLLAAMLLDLYEKMMNRNPQSDGAWTSHIEGAYNIVKARGREQFPQPTAIRILFRLSVNMTISCLVSHRPLPPVLDQLRDRLSHYFDRDNLKCQLMGLMSPYSELLCKHRRNEGSNEEIIDCAKQLNKQLIDLTIDLPPTWRFERRYVGKMGERVFGEFFDIYGERHITQIHNTIRKTRLTLMEILRERSKKLTRGAGPLFTGFDEEIYGLCLDICASVPQYTIPASNHRHHQPTLQDLPYCKDNLFKMEEGHQTSFSCYMLVFPLFLAARACPKSSDMKRWILKQLHFFSSDLGIQQAEQVVNILESGEDRETWSVYASLGSYALVA